MCGDLGIAGPDAGGCAAGLAAVRAAACYWGAVCGNWDRSPSTVSSATWTICPSWRIDPRARGSRYHEGKIRHVIEAHRACSWPTGRPAYSGQARSKPPESGSRVTVRNDRPLTVAPRICRDVKFERMGLYDMGEDVPRSGVGGARRGGGKGYATTLAPVVFSFERGRRPLRTAPSGALVGYGWTRARSCRAARSARHPVKVEVAGSNPVRTAVR